MSSFDCPPREKWCNQPQMCNMYDFAQLHYPFNKHAYCTHKNTSYRGNLTDVWMDSKLVGWTFCGHLQSVINKEGKLHGVVTYTSENPNKLCIFYIMTQNKVHLKHIFMCICYLGIKIALKCNILPILVFSKQNTRPSECRFFFLLLIQRWCKLTLFSPSLLWFFFAPRNNRT